jgi:hypothetical protein
VRRENVDFDGTHFATLLPDLEPFDVMIDAWRVGEEEPAIDGLTSSLQELTPLIDRERSSVLAGRQLRFFRGSGPIALEFLLARRPDLSFDEFVSYWRDKHTRLSSPRLAGYSQCYVDAVRARELAEQLGLPASRFDGLSEPQYDDLAHFETTSRTSAVAQIAADDEREFLDHSKCAAALIDCHWATA